MSDKPEVRVWKVFNLGESPKRAFEPRKVSIGDESWACGSWSEAWALLREWSREHAEWTDETIQNVIVAVGGHPDGSDGYFRKAMKELCREVHVRPGRVLLSGYWTACVDEDGKLTHIKIEPENGTLPIEEQRERGAIRKREMLRIAAENRSWSLEELGERLGCKPFGVLRYLGRFFDWGTIDVTEENRTFHIRLVEKGHRHRRTGPDKGGHWKVV